MQQQQQRSLVSLCVFGKYHPSPFSVSKMIKVAENGLFSYQLNSKEFITSK